MPADSQQSSNRRGAGGSSSRSNAANRGDVLDLLMQDHKRAKKAFRDFARLAKQEDTAACEQIVRQTCAELTVHTTLEEELFYPTVRDVLPDQDLLDEAEVEHASAKQLIAELQDLGADDGGHWKATFTVLGEYVKHHIKEEESELFPKLTRLKIDWQKLHESMTARREELLEHYMPAEQTSPRVLAEEDEDSKQPTASTSSDDANG